MSVREITELMSEDRSELLVCEYLHERQPNEQIIAVPAEWAQARKFGRPLR